MAIASRAKPRPAVSLEKVAAAAVAALEVPEKVITSADFTSTGTESLIGRVLIVEQQAGTSYIKLLIGEQFVISGRMESGISWYGYYLKTGLPVAFDSKSILKARFVKDEDRHQRTVGSSAYLNRMITRLTIGSDPEIFAVDAKGNLIPSFEFLNKKENLVPGTAAVAYWDGYQAEFSHLPYNCINYVCDYIQAGLKEVHSALKTKDPDAQLSLRSAFEIAPERLYNDDPKYVAFGCMPSKSAYGEKHQTFDPYIIPFRTAGGHLHFTHKGDNEAAVKELDRILGVISVSTFQYWENPQRRLLYGRAGEYRDTKYGFEYRVLSNAWLCHPVMVHFVYEIARRAIALSALGPWAEWDITEAEARECINKSDVSMARSLLYRNKKALDGLLSSLPCGSDGHNTETPIAVLVDMVERGFHVYLSEPDYPSKHWGLEPSKYRYKTYSGGKYGNLSQGIPVTTRGVAID